MNNRKQLLEVIKELESSDKRIASFSDFTIIKIPKFQDEKSTENDNNKYYAIHTGGSRKYSYGKNPGLVGEGGFSRVYLTFQITFLSELPEIVGFDFEKKRAKIHSRTKTPEINPQTKKPYPIYVTKIINVDKLKKQHKNPETVLLNEIEIFEKYYLAEPYIIHSGKDAYMITEYLMGVQLTPKFVKTLNYSERLAVIQQLLFNINLMHHETNQTGVAIIHKDIKPTNINVHILYNDPQNPKSGIKKISAHLMDFGLAKMIEEDNPHCMFNNKRFCGTVGYIAPEVFWGAVEPNARDSLNTGLKSDIYALTAVILMILGAADPVATHSILYSLIREPEDLVFQTHRYSKSLPEYDFSGIFEGYTLPDKDIQQLIIFLLKKMQSNVYQNRPNCDEVLKFFSILRIYESLKKLEKEVKSEFFNDAKVAYLATLILIAYGQWSQAHEEFLSQDENNSKAIQIIQQWRTKTKLGEETLDFSDIFPKQEVAVALVP